MSKKNHPGDFNEGDTPYAIEPDKSIRKKMGSNVPLQKIFTPEKIKECQNIINAACQNFFADALKNLAEINEEFTKAGNNLAEAKPHIKKIANLSFVLKGQAETLGFTLGFEVAKSLYNYATRSFKNNKESLVVVEKHIDVLTVVLKKEIAGDGGAIGRELLDSLAKLTKT